MLPVIDARDAALLLPAILKAGINHERRRDCFACFLRSCLDQEGLERDERSGSSLGSA